jgi:hypothetical protein
MIQPQRSTLPQGENVSGFIENQEGAIRDEYRQKGQDEKKSSRWSHDDASHPKTGVSGWE